MNEEKKFEVKISLLDWAAIFSAILILFVIYIPKSIWAEEVDYRQESRRRMVIIDNASTFYQKLTGTYTSNGLKMFTVVEGVLDSVIADSLYIGKQQIMYEGENIDVDIPKSFKVNADTTFTISQQVKRTYIDTIYSIGFYNDESGNIDTVLLNWRELPDTKKAEEYRGIFGRELVERSMLFTDYLSNKFHLKEFLLHCPLTGKPFQITVDNAESESPVFAVTSPVPENYSEPRYGVFKFYAKNYGEIRDGVETWAEL